jgi:hypothetical protein
MHGAFGDGPGLAGCGRSTRGRNQDRARGLAGRHRGLAGARAGATAGRDQLRLPRRRQPGSGRQTRRRPHGGIAARQWRRRARRQGVPGAGRGQRRPTQLLGRPRLCVRLDPHAARTPGAERQPAPAGAEPTALRRRRGRAHPGPDLGLAAARDHRAEQHRQQDLVEDRLCQPSVWQAAARLARKRSHHHVG